MASINNSRESKSTKKINAGKFYAEYHGHKVEHLKQLHQGLVLNNKEEKPTFIYLAGDSSLDNKHWFFDSFETKEKQMNDPSFTAPAINGYETILNPPRSVQDVAYHLNNEASQLLGSNKLITINASVEESTVADRDNGVLLPQDEFIRDYITSDDILIVSMGGNDVALRPTTRTAVSIGFLTKLPDALIRSGCAFGLGHMEWLFHHQIENVLKNMTCKNKPKKIIVCMIYYLDERSGGSWADNVLRVLGYDDNPGKVQLIIRTLFERIQAKGFNINSKSDQSDGEVETEIECFPLFQVLDGKNTNDYVQRVEPSVQGGKKMAKALLKSCI